MQGAHLEDPGSENSDDLQGMHAGEPSREYVLRGHSSHESLIMEGAVPAGHFSQLREPGVVANFPTSHLTHFGSGDSSEVIPAGQSLHSVFESCSCPRRQTWRHWGAPMVAYLPFSHGKQLPGPAAPSTGLYVPMGHRVHTEARVPVRSPYLPFSQLVHWSGAMP